MSPLHFRAIASTMIFIGLGSSACGSQGPEAAGGSAADPEAALAEQSQAADNCDDHPYADLDPVKLGECVTSFNQMLVRIENIGCVNAGSSTAKFWVDYWNYPAQYLAVPALNDKPAIVSRWERPWYVYVSIPLPPECLGANGSPGCSWHLVVDDGNAVREISENNNSIAGACIY